MTQRRDDPDEWFRQDWNLDDLFSSLDSEFRRMRRTMDEMMRDAAEGNLPEAGGKSPFVWGFSLRTGPDGRPQFEEFGDTGRNLFGPAGQKATVEAVAVQPVEAGAVEATPVVVKAQVVEDEDEMEFS